ncbi:SIS domain-containing protein [Candidatus Nomurabacteria bacterium]|nr:SIS domain-containing protein [Candidatus Nomurabacteria bacterium]
MQDIFKNAIAQYDTKNVFGSVELFAKQCRSTWENVSEKKEGKKVRNILVAGMGGSALGAYILQSLNIFTVPITMSHDYNIPAWVDENTLVLAISYSGGTEETLSATHLALEKKAQMVCITVGGELEKIATENNLDLRKINTEYNPCNQPRFGVGFMMMHIIKVATDYRVCNLNSDEVAKALMELEAWQNNFKQNNLIDEIYTEAQTLRDVMQVLVYSEHLTNLGRFTRNQIHETAKTLALAHEIPELNHHLMEGLEFPNTNKEKVYFMFFESNLYSEKINKRIAVTKDVLAKQGIKYTTVEMEGRSKLAQILIGMQRAMYLAYTLGIIHQKDPSDIKWVNYFKEQLAK